MVLVGGLEHEFYDFPDIGNFIIPFDVYIFQRGRLKLPTRVDLLSPLISSKIRKPIGP